MNSDVIKARFDISKELEIVNFKALLSKSGKLSKTRQNVLTAVITKGKARKWITKKNRIIPEPLTPQKAVAPKTQLAAFQGAMKLLYIIGQMIGLNSVKGILETDVGNIRFTFCCWRFLHCTFLGIAQLIAAVLCLYRLIKEPIGVVGLSFFLFFATTCLTTFLFIQIGSKWPKLMSEVSKCKLKEYVDPRVKNKCYTACVIIISASILEHLLSLLYKIVFISECNSTGSFYEIFLKDQFPWIFFLNIPRGVFFPIGIFLQVINVISTLNWNYSDLFIICMSMYLASIIEQINNKIIFASEKHNLPSSFWRALREDYSKATRLVHSFDDVISGIIFTSFASNLFFICLQLFNILAHGVNSKFVCSHVDYKGPFFGYEYTVYLLFSVIYLFARSLTTSLVAASVNTASLVPAPALYSIPSSAYCDEVSRFISQVNGDNIALSGLQFFYVTRDLVLSVAGTIVTYELVLLQFSADGIGK